jgi:hypothetical protein|tara:strand:+ start:72 stop:215 length:144 start_codon:yes stop_codon:yes gene_type:complete
MINKNLIAERRERDGTAKQKAALRRVQTGSHLFFDRGANAFSALYEA